MANIGDVLVTPENGWKRFDNKYKNIAYNGTGWDNDATYSPYKDGRSRNNQKGTDASITFNFVGTQIRLICITSTNWSSDVRVCIDGVEESFSEHGSVVTGQVLNYEKFNLEKKEHSVMITNAGEIYWGIDSIDINEDGDLKPYAPVANTILRITMIDSSDHDYELTKDEIAAFVKWYNGYTSTDTHAYALSKKIGLHVSTEYVAFEKIISFEVI